MTHAEYAWSPIQDLARPKEPRYSLVMGGQDGTSGVVTTILARPTFGGSA